MLRFVFSFLVPLLLPTALWFAWAVAVRRAEARGARWQDAPWGWLAGSGVVLAAVLLYFLEVHYGESGGRYVPSQYIDGKLVPGRFER
jgi:uncharacterized membrane protein YhaH (DUF805 family)